MIAELARSLPNAGDFDYSLQISEHRRADFRQRGFVFGVAVPGYKTHAARADAWCASHCIGGFARAWYTEDWDDPDVIMQGFTYRPDAEAFLSAFGPGTIFDLT